MKVKLLRLDLELLIFFSTIINCNSHDCKSSKKDTKCRDRKWVWQQPESCPRAPRLPTYSSNPCSEGISPSPSGGALGYSLSHFISPSLFRSSRDKLSGSSAPREGERIHVVLAIKILRNSKSQMQPKISLTGAKHAAPGSGKQTLIKEPNRMFCLDNYRSCREDCAFSKSIFAKWRSVALSFSVVEAQPRSKWIF